MARYVFQCPMRWSDMDAYRHINNVAYLRYLEDARVAWLHESGSQVVRQPNEGLVVVRNEIDYRRQLDYRHEPVPVELWVTRVNNASFTISYAVVDAGPEGERVVYADAATTLACVDLERRHPMRLSESRKAYLGHFLDG